MAVGATGGDIGGDDGADVGRIGTLVGWSVAIVILIK